MKTLKHEDGPGRDFIQGDKVEFLFFFLAYFCHFPCLVEQLPISIYTHHHIQIRLPEGGDGTECCTDACTFIEMYKENVHGFAQTHG